MSDILINDLELLKFGKCSIEGINPKELEGRFPADKFVCFGQYDQNKNPLWVIILHSFIENHECMIEMAINRKGLFSSKLFKKIGYTIADYVFNQANLLRCGAHIRVSNQKAIRLNKAWGLKFEGIKKKGFINPIEDMYMLGITKEECIWL